MPEMFQGHLKQSELKLMSGGLQDHLESALCSHVTSAELAVPVVPEGGD